MRVRERARCGSISRRNRIKIDVNLIELSNRVPIRLTLRCTCSTSDVTPYYVAHVISLSHVHYRCSLHTCVSVRPFNVKIHSDISVPRKHLIEFHRGEEYITTRSSGKSEEDSHGRASRIPCVRVYFPRFCSLLSFRRILSHKNTNFAITRFEITVTLKPHGQCGTLAFTGIELGTVSRKLPINVNYIRQNFDLIARIRELRQGVIYRNTSFLRIYVRRNPCTRANLPFASGPDSDFLFATTEHRTAHNETPDYEPIALTGLIN